MNHESPNQDIPVLHRESDEHSPSAEAVITNIEQFADVIPDAMFVAGGSDLKRILGAARRLVAVTEEAYAEESNLS